MKPGLYTDVSARDYHADPCAEPSLSSSIARVVIEQSPWHAYHQHPRLGGKVETREPTRPQEIGSAVHKMLLGRGAEVCGIDAPSYMTKAAKEMRVATYAAGKIPILLPDLETAEKMVSVAREQMASYPELVRLAEGKGASETVVVWEEDGAWCRSMIDWLDVHNPDGSVRVDIKTTTASAHPAAVASRLFGTSCEVQDRFYARGLREFFDQPIRSLFVMIEADPPHALSVVELDYQVQELGDEKVTRSIEIWRRCMATNQWPSYPPMIATVELPAWHAAKWMHNELAADAIKVVAPPPTMDVLA